MVDTYLLLFQILPASLSCLGSGLVVLTYIIFKDFRKLRYIELVFYISINDFLGSIGIAIGGTKSNSFGCWYQGITSGLNLVSSIFWTVVITYQVWLVVHRKSVIKDMTYLHVICWGLPAIVTLLPLTTNTYGNNDDAPTWCFIAETSYSPSWGKLLWELLAFYVWIWLALLISCILLISIFIRLQQMQIIPETIKSTLKKLILYPFAIFICWIFNTIIKLYLTSGGEFNYAWEIVSYLRVLGICQGLFFSLIFFIMNPLVRNHWILLINEKLSYFSLHKPIEIELSSDLTMNTWEIHHLGVKNEIDYISNDQNNVKDELRESERSFSDRESRISASYLTESGAHSKDGDIKLSIISNALHDEGYRNSSIGNRKSNVGMEKV